jgi:CO/xanthine dehydrogenase Mo-binding subunit
MLTAAVLTSPLPHARLRRVDVAAAMRVPGVRAVLTGADVRGLRQGRRLQDWPVLAWDRVRFVGDRVAAVAADTPAAAREALAAIRVVYEELPAVPDPEAALRAGAPLLHPPTEAGGYAFLAGARPTVRHPNLHGEVVVETGTSSQLAAAFAAAHRVLTHTFSTPRQHAGHLEPHAVLAWRDDAGRFRVAASNKHPFLLRAQLAATLGVPMDGIVVDAPAIGGDFGGKGAPLHEALCCLLTRATGRPVRSVLDYAEELQGATPRPATTMVLSSAVDRDGMLLAHTADVVFDGGAYAAGSPLDTLVPDVPSPAGGLSTLSAYSVPLARMRFASVYTTTVPAGHVRAPGEVQARFAGESHLDLVARELGLDPLELRRRNAVRPGGVGAAGERFAEPRAIEVLDALDRVRRERGPRARHTGLGVAVGARPVHGGRCAVTVRLGADGHVTVGTAQPEQGCGAHAALQRIVAATLDVDPARVTVQQGDTAGTPFDMGSAASRVTWVAGGAAHDAAAQLREELQRRAAAALGWASARLVADRFRDDATGAETGFAGVVADMVAAHGPLHAEAARTGDHDPDEPGEHSFYGVHVEVEVDPDTGHVTVTDAALVVDVGTVINPVAHRGQLEGGFVMGLGAALTEELTIDATGAITVHDLHGYRLPTQADVPPLRLLHLPAAGRGPFGAKPVGEIGNPGVGAAVANAVHDAVGARVTTLPITAERVHRAISTRTSTPTADDGRR